MFFLEKIQNKNNIFNNLHHILNHVSAKIYWKDVDGYYLGRNHCALEAHKALKIENKNNKVESIIGLSDHDIYQKESADVYRNNDILVLEKGCEIVKEEPLILPNGKIIVHLSSKTPLRNKAGKIMGVIGTSIEITQSYKLNALKDTLKKINTSAQSIHHLSSYAKFRNIRFTPREIDVLQLVIQGQTSKKIAAQLKLSVRTIEGYIENLKIKMKAGTKYDLIEKTLELIRQCELS